MTKTRHGWLRAPAEKKTKKPRTIRRDLTKCLHEVQTKGRYQNPPPPDGPTFHPPHSPKHQPHQHSRPNKWSEVQEHCLVPGKPLCLTQYGVTYFYESLCTHFVFRNATFDCSQFLPVRLGLVLLISALGHCLHGRPLKNGTPPWKLTNSIKYHQIVTCYFSQTHWKTPSKNGEWLVEWLEDCDSPDCIRGSLGRCDWFLAARSPTVGTIQWRRWIPNPFTVYYFRWAILMKTKNE